MSAATRPPGRIPAASPGKDSYESGGTILVTGFAAGAVTGWLIGRSADQRLARGELLGGGHRNALRAGTVMTGAGLGAMASFLIINPEGESSMDDGTVFILTTAGGAALGVLAQSFLEPMLSPASGSLGLNADGRPALVVRIEH